MSILPTGYLSTFPVQYHRHQIATGEIGVQHDNPKHPVEITFERSFNYSRNRGADAHNAIDIKGARGLRIVSSCAGIVASGWRTREGEHPGVGTSTNGGNYVIIVDNREGYYHYYAHLQSPSLLRPGQHVTPGQLIGFLGDSGKARGTPPHLHYQVSHRNDRGMVRRFLNPYPELFRLASRARPRISRGGQVVIPPQAGAPSG